MGIAALDSVTERGGGGCGDREGAEVASERMGVPSLFSVQPQCWAQRERMIGPRLPSSLPVLTGTATTLGRTGSPSPPSNTPRDHPMDSTSLLSSVLRLRVLHLNIPCTTH